MNTIQLKYALEIQKTGSITAAAQNLFLSQPNLSKAMKELEAEINMKIFQRSSKGVVPTREGKEFLDNAAVIYEQMMNFDAMYTARKKEDVNLTLCIPRATYISMAFTDFLNEILERRRINISIRERSAREAISYVASGEAHLGMIRYQDVHEEYIFSSLKEHGLDMIKLLEFEPLLVMSRNHPLASKEEISIDDLDEYIELIHGDTDDGHSERHHTERGLLTRTPSKKIYLYERGSQGDILANVKGTYMWVSNMPESVLRAGNLIMRRCPARKVINRDILIYRKGHIFSNEEKIFLDCIKRRIEALKIKEG